MWKFLALRTLWFGAAMLVMSLVYFHVIRGNTLEAVDVGIYFLIAFGGGLLISVVEWQARTMR